MLCTVHCTRWLRSTCTAPYHWQGAAGLIQYSAATHTDVRASRWLVRQLLYCTCVHVTIDTVYYSVWNAYTHSSTFAKHAQHLVCLGSTPCQTQHIGVSRAPTPSTVCKHCTSCARSTHTASSHGSFTARGATKLVVHGVRACGRRRRYGCQPVQIRKRKLRCRGHPLGPFKLPSPSLPAAGPRPCTKNISRVPLVCHDDCRSSRTRPQRLDCLHKRRSKRRSITASVQQAACWELLNPGQRAAYTQYTRYSVHEPQSRSYSALAGF